MNHVDPTHFRRALQAAAVLVAAWTVALYADGPDLNLFGTGEPTYQAAAMTPHPTFRLFDGAGKARPGVTNGEEEAPTAPANPPEPARPKMVVYYWIPTGDWCGPCKLWKKDRPELEGQIEFVDGSKKFSFTPPSFPWFGFESEQKPGWTVIKGYSGKKNFAETVLKHHKHAAPFRDHATNKPNVSENPIVDISK